MNARQKVSEYIIEAEKIVQGYAHILKCGNNRERRMTIISIAQLLQKESE